MKRTKEDDQVDSEILSAADVDSMTELHRAAFEDYEKVRETLILNMHPEVVKLWIKTVIQH